MSNVFITRTSVGIDAGASMRFRAHDKDLVEFRAIELGSELDVSFNVDALRQFIELGGQAVAEADALRAQEQAEAGPKRSEAEEQVS